MLCPICNGKTSIMDSTVNPKFKEKYRKRYCENCGYKFKTTEFIVDDDTNFEKTYVKCKNKMFPSELYTVKKIDKKKDYPHSTKKE